MSYISLMKPLSTIRHSLAHLLASAVQEIRPGTRLGFGPAIADGFYYDFFLQAPLTEADFPLLEEAMRRRIEKREPFVCETKEIEEAYQTLEEMGEPYKKEYAKTLVEKQGLKTLTFYRTGSFLDMCEGPHVDHTGQLPKKGFKIRSIAGAYWRGNAQNPMMTRIYAWAFEDAATLQKHVTEYEEAQKRDHKKLGKELEIFTIDEVIGKGLPLWLPKGTIIRDELEQFIKDLEFEAGFERVRTPHLAKQSLYYQTGHLPYYESHMFPAMRVDEEADEVYRLKPMNCPHHHRLFASRPRSYRELPLRFAEFGEVYRFEDSGALSGLLRVRGMCMNDAHIYCTEAQIEEEFLAVLEMHEKVYKTLGITDYRLRFSTWDPEDPKGKEKYIQEPESWENSQALIRNAMKRSGIPYLEEKGEAAFYGPKIDFQIRTVTGREETASTNQLDFGMPKRLDLTYVGPDNKMHRPYVIHRAPIGTHERFVAFLIEHFAGVFPLWLAPVQVRILPISDKFQAAALQLQSQLRRQKIRAELDAGGESLSKKIKMATQLKIPHLLILGEKEVEQKRVTLRPFGSRDNLSLEVESYLSRLKECIQERRLQF
jgi:threonyl-tRNA synthetase